MVADVHVYEYVLVYLFSFMLHANSLRKDEGERPKALRSKPLGLVIIVMADLSVVCVHVVGLRRSLLTASVYSLEVGVSLR